MVVVGYQEIRKRDLTGSVAKASMAELLSTPTASFGAVSYTHLDVYKRQEFDLTTQRFKTLLQGNVDAIYFNEKLYIGKREDRTRDGAI